VTIEIVRAGPLTTVQDTGRTGYGALGIPASGAMDALALRLANRLVGNPERSAALEYTLAGPEIRFEVDHWVAMTGARFEAALDRQPVPHAESFPVDRGQTLRIGRSLEGARGYLALQGGIEVPLLLGSRSTFAAGGFGGFEGRALRGGDRLPIGTAPGQARRRRVVRGVLPVYAADASLRAIPGPQTEAFTAGGIDVFFAAEYRVSSRSDRMGLRLDGPPIEHARGADLLPEGLAPGAVQVPADGQPILLAVDRPTTGGYAKIATIITADLWRLGQAKPGDRLRFVAVTVEDARALYRTLEELLPSAVAEVL
jgi:antagonist of KipI